MRDYRLVSVGVWVCECVWGEGEALFHKRKMLSVTDRWLLCERGLVTTKLWPYDVSTWNVANSRLFLSVLITCSM